MWTSLQDRFKIQERKNVRAGSSGLQLPSVGDLGVLACSLAVPSVSSVKRDFVFFSPWKMPLILSPFVGKQF